MITHIDHKRSKRSRILVWLLRRMRTRLRRREQLAVLRHKTEQTDGWFKRRYKRYCVREEIVLEHCTLDHFTPKAQSSPNNTNNKSNTKLLLFFHGGAYCLHSPAMYRAFLAKYCQTLQCEGCLPHYRLAPEHPHPAGIDDCFESYQQALRQGYEPNNITIMGDSAGGGLALSVLHLIKQHQLPMPRSVVLISPAGDWTLQGPSFYENEDIDPVFFLSSMLYYRQLYLGNTEAEPHDPLVSPVFADMSGYPPLYACTNTTELIRDVCVSLERSASQAGVTATVEIWPGLPHDLPLLGWLPEAKANNDHIVAFIEKHWRAP